MTTLHLISRLFGVLAIATFAVYRVAMAKRHGGFWPTVYASALQLLALFAAGLLGGDLVLGGSF